MHMRTLLIVLALAIAAQAGAPRNWKGALDTVSIRDTLEEDTLKYSAALPLTDGEDVRVLLKATDTSTAGWASDSLKLFWGYQIGSITRDTGGAQDTVWPLENRIAIDTLDVDSFGVGSVGVAEEDGTLTRYWNRAADTLSVRGYAIQDRWFVPEWDELIRFWAQGLADNNGDSPIILIFELHQRRYVPVE